MQHNIVEEPVIEVTAKCPKCKRKKIYYSDEPLNHTPHCPHGCGMPMFVVKTQTRTRIQNKKKNSLFRIIK